MTGSEKGEIIKESNFCIIDTETGGLDPQKHSILSVGIVIADRENIIDGFEIKIKEDNIATTPGSMAVNKIDLKEHVKEALSPEDTVNKIIDYFAGRENVMRDDDNKVVPIGHNIYFDIDFMHRLFNLAGVSYMKYFSHRNLDTSTLLRFFNLTGKLDLNSASLASACEYLEVENSRAHNALSDAKATAEVFQKLLKL
ncbi:MAG: exonuclease domain-containing protein [Elusimicrobiota bacterium]